MLTLLFLINIIGTSMLISGLAEDVDALWCFSQDMYPFKPAIKETKVPIVYFINFNCSINSLYFYLYVFCSQLYSGNV